MPFGDKLNYLEPAEVRAIIKEVERISPNPERDVLLMELLWQSGARVSEALGLTYGHIGTNSLVLTRLKQRRPVIVNGKVLQDASGRKVKEKDPDATKNVDVSKDLCERLKKYCRANHLTNYVFELRMNKPLYRQYVWRILGRASENVGILKFGKRDDSTKGRFKGAYPHMLRHSNAMMLLEASGGDLDLVKQQLGHSSVMTTEVYAQTKKAKIRKVVDHINW